MAKTHFPRSGGQQWTDSYYSPLRPLGNEVYVQSGTGSASNGGYSPETARATIANAITLCTANNDDLMVVGPGHSESVTSAAALDFSIAGLTVVGRGSGSLKPTITLSTATTATVRVNAANVTLRNLRFVGAVDSLVKMIDVNADHCTLEDCDFITSSTLEALSFVNLATTKDYLTLRRCRFIQPTDPAGSDGGADTGGIYLVDSEHVVIDDCQFHGQFETAWLHNRTTGCANVHVRNCGGIQTLSGAEPFQFVSTATGRIEGGLYVTPAETAVTEATLSGTIPAGVFSTARFGNDGGGGQNAVSLADAS